MDNPPPPLIPLPFFIDDSHSRISRETTQVFKQILETTYIYLHPFFETYPEDIYTIPLIREHHDACLYYIDTQKLAETPDETCFSILFTSPPNFNETFRKNIYPIIIFFTVAHVFTTFLKNLCKKIISYLNMLPLLLLYKPSFKTKSFLSFPILNNFELLKKPHHLLTTDQIFQNFTVNTQTKENIPIYSLFLR